MYNYPYELEHIFSYSAQLETEPEVIGPLSSGIRANFYVTSGEVVGPTVNGILRPVGGDWLTIRPDGISILDVRATIETHDGALIDVAYSGVADAGEDGHAKFLAQELPEVLKIHAVPRFQTCHPDYLWLNRIQAINIGQLESATLLVTYDTYAIRS